MSDQTTESLAREIGHYSLGCFLCKGDTPVLSRTDEMYYHGKQRCSASNVWKLRASAQKEGKPL